jgi:hypothetical protein
MIDSGKTGTLRTREDGVAEIRLSRSWIGVHEIVWRAARGPVPEGGRLVFLNGDVRDIRLENLELKNQ